MKYLICFLKGFIILFISCIFASFVAALVFLLTALIMQHQYLYTGIFIVILVILCSYFLGKNFV